MVLFWAAEHHSTPQLVLLILASNSAIRRNLEGNVFFFNYGNTADLATTTLAVNRK